MCETYPNMPALQDKIVNDHFIFAPQIVLRQLLHGEFSVTESWTQYDYFVKKIK